MQKKLLCLYLAFLPLWALAQLGYTQRGEASYYADRFHGRKTASGERYDKAALTAAHRELAFGTRVRVQNLGNGKSVVVVINDRGPWSSHRIIDLSKAAAQQLDMMGAGVAEVKIVVISDDEPAAATTQADEPAPQPVAKPEPVPEVKPEPRPAPAPPTPKPTPRVEQKPVPKPEPKPSTPPVAPPPAGAAQKPAPKPAPAPKATAKPKPYTKAGTWNMYGDYLKPDGWGLQLGTFSSVDNALAFCQKVKESGYSKLFIQQIPVGSGYTYKVVLGAYSTVEMARSYEAEVKKKGYDSFAIAHLP